MTFALYCNRACRSVAVRTLFRGVSRLGNGVFWYSLMLALIVVDGAAAGRPVLQMLLAGALGVLVYRWLKQATLRPRPYQIAPDIVVAATPLDQFSFPSGHTLHAVSFSTIACSHYPDLAPLLLPFVALVAASRPILGLHYPSDVLAGAAIGASIGGLALLF
ncbi:MAG: phosphatase PAP2 family protein [Pseudomonadota bacterium]